MSALMITGLVLAALFLLVGIGYVIQVVEKQNLERARRQADLHDRLRRCSNLSESLPGQLMTVALKLVLSRLELHLRESLQRLDKASGKQSGHIAALRTEIAKGEDIEVRNPSRQILNDAQAKEVRFMLEDLQAQIIRAAKDGQLQPTEAKHWLEQIQRMAAMIYIEYFTNLGNQALERNQPHQARLAFERGLQHIRKQPAPSDYEAQLKHLEADLERANALQLALQQPERDESNALSEGLKRFEDDDQWKKNNVY